MGDGEKARRWRAARGRRSSGVAEETMRGGEEDAMDAEQIDKVGKVEREKREKERRSALLGSKRRAFGRPCRASENELTHSGSAP